jgi:hypothetical protein
VKRRRTFSEPLCGRRGYRQRPKRSLVRIAPIHGATLCFEPGPQNGIYFLETRKKKKIEWVQARKKKKRRKNILEEKKSMPGMCVFFSQMN